MKNFFFLAVGLALILGSVFLFLTRVPASENTVKVIQINNVSLTVEVAETTSAHQQGLSGRRVLLEGTGMLFVFNHPGQYGFWMKNMRFPIDIIWLDEFLTVVDITRNFSPKTFPKVFYPNQAVKYVLELPAGSADRYHIDIGQVVIE